MQDYNARQIIAYTLAQGLGQDISADDVIAVSAMEAVGVAAAMERFEAIDGNPKVASYTYLPRYPWVTSSYHCPLPGCHSQDYRPPASYIVRLYLEIKSTLQDHLQAYFSLSKVTEHRLDLPKCFLKSDCSKHNGSVCAFLPADTLHICQR